MSVRTKAAFAILLALGLLATLGASSWVAKDTRNQRARVRNEGAEMIAEDVATKVDDALIAAQGLGRVADSIWPTVDEYQAFWDTYSSVLEGDPTSVLVLAVPTIELPTFVAAETDINPEFSLSFVNDQPPNGESLLTMRSGNSEIPLGIDLTSLPGSGERLMGVTEGAPSILNSDIREPAAQPGFLQVIRRLEVNGPDGIRRDAWSVVQVDLQWILDDAVQAAGDNFGASFDMVDVGPGGVYGIEAVDGADTAVRTFFAGDLELTMETWHDGQAIGDGAVTQTALVGLALTLGLTLIGYLAVSSKTNRNRARKGESDARRDPLTGLVNRRWIGEHLADLVGESVAVLFCDLDRFKVVNDSAGHAAGDQLLVEVGARIAAVLEDDAHVARFGGDEFLVVCSRVEDIDDHAEAVADRIREVMEQPFVIAGNEFRATMSVGIATAHRMQSGQSEELIRAADVALGMCKKSGRNGFVRYNYGLREAELDRLGFERDLQVALDQGDLVVHYQPIVDREQRPVSYEALVRWKRNDSLVSPAFFLPVVEEIGRMSDLGDIVLDIAVADFAAGIDPESSTTLHVNVDATQLADTAFPNRVQAVLEKNGLDAGRLVLELTEGEWAASIEFIGPVLEALGELGVRLAIDDFGTGHSSLGRALDVKALAEVKLDRSVVRQLFEPRNHAFFSGLAKTLVDIGVSVIAEGIETVEDLRCAEGAGVGLFQGFMFARPAPAAETSFACIEPLGPVAERDSSGTLTGVLKT